MRDITYIYITPASYSKFTYVVLLFVLRFRNAATSEYQVGETFSKRKRILQL